MTRPAPSVTRNTLWNLGGQLVPLGVGLATIPPLIGLLGTDRFGLLTIVWIVIGYFGLLDLGLGRALTQLVAARRATGEHGALAGLVWTGMLLMLGVSLLAVVLVWALAPWLTYRALNVPDMLRRETLQAFRIVALTVPLVVAGAGLRGVLEGLERFDLTNTVRLAVSSLTYAAPLGVSLFTPDLALVVASLTVTRAVGAGLYLWLCLRTIPATGRSPGIARWAVRPLLSLGGWMTVSNVVSPIMVYLDRFLIGAIVTMTAVAYYTTPYEVVIKLLVVPAALSGVLFPAFARGLTVDPAYATRLFARGSHATLVLLFPPTLVLFTLAPELLELWVGPAFSQHSTTVARVLLAGLLVNGLAHIPFVLVQGAGRADITAKFHLLELPLYVSCLWWLTGRYGIEGAAATWTGRVVLDAVLLFGVSWRLLPASRPFLLRLAALVGGAAVLLVAALALYGWGAKSLYVAVTLAGFGVAGWRLLLDADDRAFMRRALGAAG